MAGVLASFADLLTYLAAAHVPHAPDLERQVVEIPTQAPGALYLRWEKDLPYIQIIHFVLENLVDDRLDELDTAVARLNNAIEVPGFGIDHAGRRLYYRRTLIAFKNAGVDATLLQNMCQLCVNAARRFHPALLEVAQGAPGDQILALAATADEGAGAGEGAGEELKPAE